MQKKKRAEKLKILVLKNGYLWVAVKFPAAASHRQLSSNSDARKNNMQLSCDSSYDKSNDTENV